MKGLIKMKINELLFSLLKFLYEKTRGPIKHYFAIVLFKDGKIYLQKGQRKPTFLPVVASGAGTPLLEYQPDVPIEIYTGALRKSVESQLEGRNEVSLVFGSKAYNLRPFKNASVTFVLARIQNEPSLFWESYSLSNMTINTSEGLLYDLITEEVSNLNASGLL